MGKPSHAIKLVMGFVFALPFFMAACDSTKASSSQAADFPIEIPQYQKEKQKIIDDFYESPINAKSIYLALWKNKKNSRADDKSIGSRIIWLTIAGGLIETDSSNYEEYYSYITHNLSDTNWEVAATAVNALRGAHGHESIDYIISMINDNREMVAADAVLAIDYRLKTAFFEPSLKSDYNYAFKKMHDICKSNSNARRLKQVCRENKITL